MSAHWHIGMEVVFVGYPAPASITHGDKKINRVAFLSVGNVYPIIDIKVRSRFATGKWAGPSIYVGFEDLVYGPVWHHHSGFRPVQKRSTSIEALKALLNPSEDQKRALTEHDLYEDARALAEALFP